MTRSDFEIREIVDEEERGCGFRKPGGTYMMAGGPMAPCGKLPLEVTVCPCCSQGIKPARGFTWINAQRLFDGVECDDGHGPLGGSHGCICVLDDPPEKAGLVWIGGSHYPTPEAFLDEARTQGVSRRIPAVPQGFEVGKTWVLFAHREAITKYCSHPTIEREAQGFQASMLSAEEIAKCPDCDNGIRTTPGIIGAFLPDRIEYVVRDEDTPYQLDRKVKQGLTLVKLRRTDGEEAADELRRDEILAQQELEDFAQDGEFENQSAADIL